MSRNRLAFDSTARTVDADGRLHISKSHISKACVNPYYGHEVPGAAELGLEPNRKYMFLRSPEELAKAAPTFARLPILSKHVPIAADNHPHEIVVGAIGSDVVFNDPYLDADTSYWDNEAIAGIETGVQREHSAAYRWIPLMTPGNYQGVPYDGIMTEIRGNHLALVEAGRAGSDVLAADAAIPTEKEKPMAQTKKGKALNVTLAALSPKIAQDSSLPGLVADAGKKNFNRDAVRKAVIAMDAELDEEKIVNVMEAILDADPAEDADPEDETEEEKKKRLAKEKEVAKDAEPVKKDDKPAMDAAIATVKREIREADEARRAVRPVVGDVIAMDSAAEIYGFALDTLKVPHTGVTELAGLKGLFDLSQTRTAPATKTVMALDSAASSARFPGADRFKHA